MSGSILGIYKQDVPKRNDIRVGTPDPTKYHDSSKVRLEGGNKLSLAANLPGNHGFSGLRGTIIPRSTGLGGSMGHDPHKPQIIRIDPELIGGDGIVVDLSRVRADDMAQAVLEEQQAGYDDPADAVTAAFARFSNCGQIPRQQQNRLPVPSIQANEREAPLQMPGTYVVPKATSGGGQVRPASFSKTAVQVPLPSAASPVPPRQQSQPAPQHTLSTPVMPALPSPPPPPSPPPTSQDPYVAPPPVNLGRHIEETAEVARRPQFGFQRPLRPVTFEIPRVGEMTGYYHDVVCEGMALVLIFDHNYQAQFIWFPPLMEDENHEPMPIAAVVHGVNGEPDIAYKLQTTPVRFRYRSEEFCVLLVEKEKVINPREG